MAEENKGILIDVGFNADVSSLISKINKELKKANFEDNINIEKRLTDQLNNVAKKIKEVNEIGWSNKGAQKALGDVKKYNDELLKLTKARRVLDGESDKTAFSDFHTLFNNRAAEAVSHLKEEIEDFAKVKNEFNNSLKSGFSGTSANDIYKTADAIRRLEYAFNKNEISYSKVGISEGEFKDFSSKYKEFIDGIIEKIDTAAVSNGTSLNLPVEVNVATDSASIKQQVSTLLGASRTYLLENPLKAKIEIDTGYQSQKIRNYLKGITEQLDSENPSDKVIQEKLNSIGEIMNRGFEIKLDTEKFKADAEAVAESIIELRNKVEGLNDDLYIKPRLALNEDAFNEFKSNLANLNELISADALAAVEALDKAQGELKLNSASATIDQIAKSISSLSSNAQDMQPLVDALSGIVKLLEVSVAIKPAELAAGFNQLKSSLVISGDETTIFDTLQNIDVSAIENAILAITKSSIDGKLTLPADFKRISESVATYAVALETLNKNKKISFPSIDLESKKFEAARETFVKFEAALEMLQEKKDAISNPVVMPEIINTTKEQQAISDENKNAVLATTAELQEKINLVQQATESLKSSLGELTNVDQLTGLILSLGEAIPSLNTEAVNGGILSVLNEVLDKEGAINALANLFNGQFVQKLNSTSTFNAEDITKGLKSGMLDEFYARAERMPELLNKAFTGGQTGILEYAKNLEGLFNSYDNILGDRLNPQNSIISKEEYQDVKEYMSALISDIQSEMSHIFDNLYSTATPNLKRQLDAIKNDLVASMPKGLTQEGNIAKTKESLTSYQEAIKSINTALSQSQDNILTGFYEKAAKLPDVFKNVISSNSVANVKEYKDLMSDILSTYQMLVDDSKRGKNRVFDKEEFAEAKAFLSGTFKELNSEITNITKNMTAGLGKNGKAVIAQELAEIKSIIPSNLSNIGDSSQIGNVSTLLSSAQKNVDAFTAKAEKAKQTFEGFKTKINELGSGLKETYEQNKTIDVTTIVKKLTTIHNWFEKIRQAAEDGFISQKAVTTAENRIFSLGKTIENLYKKKLGKDALSLLPDNAISESASLLGLIGDTDSANLFRNTVSAAYMAKRSLASQNTGTVNVEPSIAELEELGKVAETVAVKLERVQQAGFGGDAENTYHFIELLKAATEAYNKFSTTIDEGNAWEKIFEDEKYSKVYRSLKLVAEAFAKLGDGYDRFLASQKKTLVDKKFVDTSVISNELKELLSTEGGLNAFSIPARMTEIESTMNAARDASNRLFSDQNTLANGLSFSKLLGKIYNDMANNSKMSGELRGKFEALAEEMKSTGTSGTSKTLFDTYSKRFQALDTELKRTGQTGKNFFTTLRTTMVSQSAQLIGMTFSFYRLIGVFKQGIQTATEFDSTLAKISYTMDVSTKELNGMGDEILRLSKNLKTSISSMEQIYTIYANMNTSSEEIAQLSEYTAVLSNLSGIDASAAADDIQAVVNQFNNLSSVDTSHIVDVYDYISRNISVDYTKGIEGMAEGVQAVGNVADQAGLSYEQLSAVIAKTMEQTRNSGSSIANGLKTIMVRLSKASTMDDEVDNETLSKASAVLHDIGVEVYTTEGEFREFDTIMTELAGKWDSLTEAQQANISFQIAATRQTATLKAILSNWTDSMDLATEATNTNGNALENQEKYSETYAAKLQDIKNSFSELAIELFRTDGFNALLTIIGDITEATSGLLSNLGLIPTALAAITVPIAFKEIGSAVGMLKSLPALGGLFSTGKDALNTAINSGFDVQKVTEYGMALDGLSARQAQLVVSTSGLNASEQALVMTRYNELQQAMTISSYDLEQILTKNQLDDAQIKSISSTLALSGAMDKLTESELRNALATAKVNTETTEQVVTQTAAKASATASAATGPISKLTTGFKGLASAIGLTSVELLGVIGGIVIAVGVIKKISDAIVTNKEYLKSLKNASEDFQKEADEISSLSSELENAKQKQAELNKLKRSGDITVTQERELELLQQQTAELEAQIALQKKKAEEEAEDLIEEAQDNPTFGYNVFTSFDGVEVTDSTKDINEAINETIKTLEEGYGKTGNLGEYAEEYLTENAEFLDEKISAYQQVLASLGELAPEEQAELDKLIATRENLFKYWYKTTGDTSYYDGLSASGKVSVLGDEISKAILGNIDKGGYISADAEKALYDQADAITSRIQAKASRVLSEGLEVNGELIDLTNMDLTTSFEELVLPDNFDTMSLDAKANSFVNAWIESIKRNMVGADGEIIAAMPSFDKAWADLDDSETYDGLKDSLSELAEKGQLTLKTFDKTPKADNWIESIGLSAEETVSKINDLYKDLTRLDSFKSSVTSLQEAYKEKGAEDSENIVGADTLNSLSETFGDLKGWEEYRNAAGSSTTTLEELKKATDDLLTEYYNQGEIMNDLVDEYGNVDEATKQYYISQLDEMGIANAVEVVENKIAYSKAQNAAQTYLSNGATLEEVQALEKEGKALEGTSAWFVYYSIKKELANATHIDTSDDINNLKALIKQLDNASESVKQLANIETMLAEAEGLKKIGGTAGVQGDYIIEQANKLREQLPDIVKQEIEDSLSVSSETKIDFDVSGLLSGTEDTSSTDKETKTSEEIDWIARRIDVLNEKIEQCDAKLQNLFKPKAKNKLLNQEIKLLNKELETYTIGAQKYLSKFNSVVKKNKGVLTNNIVKKIKNGKVKGNLSQLIQTFGSEDATIIKDAIDWWDKYQEFRENRSKTITTRREKRIEKHQNWIDYYQGWSDYRETQGNDFQRGFVGQNKALNKQEKLTKKIYAQQIKIAKINKDDAEVRKLKVELAQKLNELEKQEFDNIVEHYNVNTQRINDLITLNESQISLAEARGQKANIGLYAQTQKWDRTEWVNLNAEATDLRKQLKNLNSGSKEYADALHELQDVSNKLIQMEIDYANQNQKIQKAYDDLYSNIVAQTNRIATEAEFELSLLAHEKNTSIKDNAVKDFYTATGLTALDTYQTGIMTSKANATAYKELIDSYQAVLDNPSKYLKVDESTGFKSYVVETPFGTNVFNSIEELETAMDSAYDSYQSLIKTWYDNETKIYNVVKERYETELSYVKELIDAKKEQLDAEKDLHDYQKTINEKTNNITNLQRQIAAYTGNSSEEGLAKLQSLQQQLKEAQEDLEETEYDRYISDQKDMLDDLYEEYEENINNKLEQFYELVQEGINSIVEAISNQTQRDVEAQYDYTPQYTAKTKNGIQTEIKNTQERVVSESGVDDLSRDQSVDVESIIKGLAQISKNFKYDASGKTKSEVSAVNQLIWDKLGKNWLLTKAGLQALAKQLGVTYSNGKASKTGDLYKYLKNAGFSTGGIVSIVKRNGDDGLATLKKGEAVLTPRQTQQFAILADNLSSLNKMVGVYGEVAKIGSSKLTNNIDYGGVNFNFTLPNVTDSSSFVSAIKKDVDVQRALRAVTIDQIVKQKKIIN